MSMKVHMNLAILQEAWSGEVDGHTIVDSLCKEKDCVDSVAS